MEKVRKRGKIWYYRFIDADGKRVERKGCSDKRETEAMGRAAETRAARVRAGLDDPRVETYRRQSNRPVPEHLEEWRAHMIARGRTEKHARLYLTRASAIVAASGVGSIGDLSPSIVQAAIGGFRASGLSLQTLDHYARAIKAFSRWLYRDGRAVEDRLLSLVGYNAAEDRRHERRALTPEETAGLIRAAGQGPVVLRVSGTDRAMVYRLALGAGLRAGELRSLTPGSFNLDASPPTVTVAARDSKRRRKASPFGPGWPRCYAAGSPASLRTAPSSACLRLTRPR